MKILTALGLTLVYIALLLSFYFIHAWYFPVKVVLYSALLDAVLAAIVLIVLIFTVPCLRRTLSGFEFLLLVVIWLLGGYAFAITGPTVLDRSLSFYILEKLEQRGGGIRQDEIGSVFINEYLPEYQLVNVRLIEQLQSGTIIVKNGCVALTPKGKAIVEASRYLRRHFLPRVRLLNGEYTNALNNPFEHSPQGPQGYECKIDQ